MPRSNGTYWSAKLRGNVERDRRVDLALAGAGWSALRIWEHEIGSAPSASVKRVERVLDELQHVGRRTGPQSDP